MRPTLTRWMFAASLTMPASLCQLPASEKLSDRDWKLLHAEIRRLEQQLETASDKCTVMYAIARTWASAGQYREAMDWLARVVARNVGLDPSRDSSFAKLHNAPEFRNLVRKIRTATPPVLRSRAAFSIVEADLLPEGIAYDPRGKQFYFGSTWKHKIVRCTEAGVCQPFVAEGQDGIGKVLGLRVHPGSRTLWAAGNEAGNSALFHYDLQSGKLIRKYVVSGGKTGHVFNDLAVTAQGDVFVTDTRANAVYWVSHKTDALAPFAPDMKIEFPNGIALSDDDKKIYVAGFGDGITVVDLDSRSAHPIGHPSDLCLATIDGLYFYRNSLVAIQSGVMAPRVVRYYLTQDRNGIERFEILERRNPLFDGITTGAIVGGDFYYMANTQLDKVADGKVTSKARLSPLTILKIALDSAVPARQKLNRALN